MIPPTTCNEFLIWVMCGDNIDTERTIYSDPLPPPADAMLDHPNSPWGWVQERYGGAWLGRLESEWCSMCEDWGTYTHRDRIWAEAFLYTSVGPYGYDNPDEPRAPEDLSGVDAPYD